jgi:hypothetical protein
MAEKRITPKAPEAKDASKDTAAARVTKTSMKKTTKKKHAKKHS